VSELTSQNSFHPVRHNYFNFVSISQGGWTGWRSWYSGPL